MEKLGSLAVSFDILKKTNIGLWAFEFDEGCERRMYANDTMLGLLGLTEQATPEETYRFWYDRIDNDHRDEVMATIDKMIGGIHAEVQYPWHHPGGQTWIMRCGGVRNKTYTKGVRMEGTHQDVTGLAHFEKQKVQELTDIIEALGSDFKYVSYIESDTLKENVFRYDEAFAAQIPGWEDARTYPQRAKMVCEKFVHPDDRERFIEETNLQNIIDGLSRNSAVYVNFRELAGDQVSYYQNKYVQVEVDGISNVVMGLKSVDEITREQLTYQTMLNEAMEKAEAANKAKTSFLFNMSHDIRTPMNAIIGFNNVARNHIDEKEKVIDCLNKVEASSKHLLSLINDVLDMARIEAGKISLEEGPICITASATDMIEMIRESTDKDLAIEDDFSGIEHDYVLADKLRVNRVMANIISNSVKYTEDGGRIKFTISEKPSCKKGCYSYDFIIEDTGIGMSEEFLEHIFEEFSREKPSTITGVQGTGLGMAIAKELVDMMDGTIQIASTLGEGTTVRISLDLQAVDAETLEDEGKAPIDISVLEGKKILLVEDNELNREIAKDILEDYGIILDEAENGEVAVTKYAEAMESGDWPYDMILMDVQMPVMDGYEATRVLRSMMGKGEGRIPIIAMTANAFAEDKRKALECGMDGHLAKPLDIDELERVLTSF